MTARRDVGTTAVVVVAFLAPLVAGSVLALRAASQSPLESASQAEPLIAVVESAERRNDVQAGIAVEYAEAIAPAGNASGTLTAVDLAPGTTIGAGTVVGQVDFRDLVAYSSAAPLFRDITRGLKGDDVRIAQEVLTGLGYGSVEPDGNAGVATERAIRTFNAAHGYGDQNPVLSLASLVWIGTGPVTVAESKVTLGGAVAPGTELFTTTASLAAIAVTEPASLTRDAAVELTIGEVTTAYEPGRGRVTEPEAVAAIAELLGQATQGSAVLRLVDPVSVGTVPASAVVTDELGRTCIFTDLASGFVPVEPVGGSLGTVDLDPSLIGRPVLVNPRDVREDLACG